MTYYIASIKTLKDDKHDIIEHYYIVHDDEDIKDKVLKSLFYYEDKHNINRIDLYKYDFTIYDDTIEEHFKELDI